MALQTGNLGKVIPALFTGRGGQLMTPDQIAREREIAAALMAPNEQPVTNWADGVAGLVDAFSGKMRERRADQASSANASSNQRIQQALLGGMGGGSAPSPTPAFMPRGSAPSLGSGTPAATIPTGDRAGYIREGLINRGLPAHVADAFIVNFQDESGLDPGINEAKPLVPGSRGGFGLYQSTGPRRVALEGVASARGRAPSDIDTQLDVLAAELGLPGTSLDDQPWFGSEARAARSIMDAPDTATAAQAIVNNFLRPAESHRNSRARRYAGLGNTATEGVQMASLEGPSAETMNALMSGAQNAQPAPTVAQGLMAPTQMAQAAPPQQYQPPAAPALNPAIIEALSSPYADDQTRAIAQMLFQQNSQQRAAAAQAANEWNQLQEQRAYDYGLTQEQRGYDRFNTLDDRLYTEGREDARYAVDDGFERQRIDLQRQGLTPTSIREYEYARQQGYEGSFSDFEQAQRRAGATNVTTNVGEGNKFYETLDTEQAKTFSALSEEGVRGRSKLAQIDRLDGLLSNAQTGGLAMLKQAAGEWGIPTEGLSDIQAAQALINELVPQQRQPGSGPMSDADLALFKQSLPRLINQPGGNQTIINTMRGITAYQIQMGEIADAVADRAMTPAQAREAIRGLSNPLEGFSMPQAQPRPDTTRRDGGVPVGGSAQRLRFNPATGDFE